MAPSAETRGKGAFSAVKSGRTKEASSQVRAGIPNGDFCLGEGGGGCSGFQIGCLCLGKLFFITEENFAPISSQIRGKKMAVMGLCQTVQLPALNGRHRSLSGSWGNFPSSSQTSQCCDCHQFVNWSCLQQYRSHTDGVSLAR